MWEDIKVGGARESRRQNLLEKVQRIRECFKTGENSCSNQRCDRVTDVYCILNTWRQYLFSLLSSSVLDFSIPNEKAFRTTIACWSISSTGWVRWIAS